MIHSVTKMLNGHSDVLGGTVAGSTELINQIWYKLRNFGGSMDPHQASLVERGIKTLQIRYERSTENAGILAKWLDNSYAVFKDHEKYLILTHSENYISNVKNSFPKKLKILRNQ